MIHSARAEELNRAAKFENGPYTPALVVGGVAVHVYADPERGYVISVHTDTGEVPADMGGDSDIIPMEVNVNGTVVFSA